MALYVVDNASVFVFMYIGQRRHVRSTSATIICEEGEKNVIFSARSASFNARSAAPYDTNMPIKSIPT